MFSSVMIRDAKDGTPAHIATMPESKRLFRRKRRLQPLPATLRATQSHLASRLQALFVLWEGHARAAIVKHIC
jgi:hypothetical protein